MTNTRNSPAPRRRRRPSSTILPKTETQLLNTQTGADLKRDDKYRDLLQNADLRSPIIPRVGWCQLAVFLAIYELGSDAYGANIIEWFRARRGGDPKAVNAGQIYGTITALAEEGFLVGTPHRPPSGRGRNVIVYAMSSKGRLLLKLHLIWLKEFPPEDRPDDDTPSIKRSIHRAPRRQM